jgi:glycosyltransferase involved in cell wall biosynthesis
MLVSIVIPAYNAAHVMTDAIASVQSQTYVDWELLIIDDGSTDHTAKVVQCYQQTDPRIHLICQSNQGVSAARNLGVEKSHGQFIAFLDADDQWLPQKLSTHLAHFDANPNLGVSFARVEIFNPDEPTKVNISTARLNNLQPEHFLAENPTTTPSNWVIRRSAWDEVGDFCPEMCYSEDLEWLLRVRCTTEWMIEGIDQVLIRYRTSSTGLSADLDRMEAGWNTLVNQAKTYAPEIVQQHFALAQAIHLRYLARRAIRLKVPAKAGVDFMTRALRSHWQLPLIQPRRTLLTMAAVYSQPFLAWLRSLQSSLL